MRGHTVACEQLLRAAEAQPRSLVRAATTTVTNAGLEKHDQPQVQCVLVMDLEGLGTQHMSSCLLRLFKDLNDSDAANFPELIGDIFVVNVGWVFTALWSLISPLVDTTTASKVHVHRSGEPFDCLVSELGAECLPTELGGAIENALPYQFLRQRIL